MSFIEPTEKPRLVSDNTTGLPSADLQRFAKAGLDLKIGDFRRMCEQLGSQLDLAQRDSQTDPQLASAVADILFAWMTQTLGTDK